MQHPLPEPYILGVDESGRGPVLGHMVYCTCVCPESKKDDLAQLGFDDSKVLTAQQRERMFEEIKQTPFLEFTLDPISPLTISSSMLRRSKISLNDLAHSSTIALIQAWLDLGYNIQEVYIDTIGNAEHYQTKLQRQFPSIGKIVVAKKADSLYPIVSAASICAKVTRDLMLRDWQLNIKKTLGTSDEGGPEEKEGNVMDLTLDEEESSPGLARSSRGKRKEASSSETTDGVFLTATGKRIRLSDKMKTYTLNFGSGYPSDPATKKWLLASLDPVFGFPEMVRHSWKTAAILVDSHCVQADWGDDDAADGKQSKLSFVAEESGGSGQGQIGQTSRHPYFRDSHLHTVTSRDI